MDNIIENEEFKFEFIKGSIPVILMAPHAHEHTRKGRLKKADANTLMIVKKLHELTDCHIVYTNDKIDYDPNFDIKNDFKKEVVKYIKEHDILFALDIHGMSASKFCDLEIGTSNLKNINYDEKLLNIVKNILKKDINKIKVDRLFKASTRTLSSYINRHTNIKTFQFEISADYRKPRTKKTNYERIINSLNNVVYTLSRSEKIEEINYVKIYDNVLDIKAYSFEKKFGVISFDEVGLEIEVAVNYDRNSFTFIKTMLEKIKLAVGENGHFVKDGTILGDYSFEIVMYPMSVKDITKIYTKIYKIIEFSSGLIEISKEKNCGIHLNFNKFDVTDLNEGHKRITSFVVENKNLFEENIYKQFKFIWDYAEYIEYQDEISAKYTWINYIKKKIIEIRNIKSKINPEELKYVLESSLDALYYDKREVKKHNITYDRLHELYSLLLNEDETLNKNLLIINFENGKPNIMNITKELEKEILKSNK